MNTQRLYRPQHPTQAGHGFPQRLPSSDPAVHYVVAAPRPARPAAGRGHTNFMVTVLALGVIGGLGVGLYGTGPAVAEVGRTSQSQTVSTSTTGTVADGSVKGPVAVGDVPVSPADPASVPDVAPDVEPGPGPEGDPSQELPGGAEASQPEPGGYGEAGPGELGPCEGEFGEAGPGEQGPPEPSTAENSPTSGDDSCGTVPEADPTDPGSTDPTGPADGTDPTDPTGPTDGGTGGTETDPGAGG